MSFDFVAALDNNHTGRMTACGRLHPLRRRRDGSLHRHRKYSPAQIRRWQQRHDSLKKAATDAVNDYTRARMNEPSWGRAIFGMPQHNPEAQRVVDEVMGDRKVIQAYMACYRAVVAAANRPQVL